MKLEDIKSKTKDAVDYLVQSLESGHSEVLTQYLGTMARFHTYSFGNVMLIARQKPDATNVAGIRTWNSLGRFVKRGEKGILILAPMVGNRRSRQNEIATDIDTENAADERKPEHSLIGFRAVYVFDISQTEGKELPTLAEVHGDVSGYRERLFDFVQSHGVELSYSERIAPAKGLSHGGKITLLSGMKPAEEFSTLVHEIAHEMLHRGDRRTTKKVRETEAEAVAFVVAKAIGLETGTASADYIQLWHGDANLLRESLEAVQQTAAVILGVVAPKPEQAQESDTSNSPSGPSHLALRHRSGPLPRPFRSDFISYHQRNSQQRSKGEVDMQTHVQNTEYRDVPVAALIEPPSNPMLPATAGARLRCERCALRLQ
jgi:hypothetical protein